MQPDDDKFVTKEFSDHAIMKVFKGITIFFSIIICYILCSIGFAFFCSTFIKPLEFGREFIGMEYSAIIHHFGKEPDVIEKFTMRKADEEFKKAYGSFIDSCNSEQQVIKFTYKNMINDLTLWAYDNGDSTEIILAR